MNNRTLVEQALHEARRQQTAYDAHTASWIIWEQQIQALEHRLVVAEVDDGPPNSILREKKR